MQNEPLDPKNPKGFKDREGKPPVYLIPTRPLLELAKLYGAGMEKVMRLSGCEQKDAAHNWRNGIPVSEAYAAAMRHWWKFWGEGEDIDEQTGCHHLSCATFWANAIQEFLGVAGYPGTHPECDDRYRHKPGTQETPVIGKVNTGLMSFMPKDEEEPVLQANDATFTVTPPAEKNEAPTPQWEDCIKPVDGDFSGLLTELFRQRLMKSQEFAKLAQYMEEREDRLVDRVIRIICGIED